MDATIYRRLYKSLRRIRRTEEEIARVYPSDKIKSPVHLSIGEEAVAVGVCEALLPEDVIFATYRGHAAYLAKGGDLNKMIAELYGKHTGCSKGKGGSMHLADVQAGVMGTSAIVGTSIANAVGYSFALQSWGRDRIVASFFGDGATEEGVFYECLNFASLKKLPIIFICENNLYAIHTHQSRRQAVTDICGRARSFGIPAERIEDNDVVKIYESVGRAAEMIRHGGEGPFFFECMTYRWKEHVGPNEDYHLGYRTLSEAEPWMKNDQVTELGSRIDPGLRALIDEEVEMEIAGAFTFAETSPYPDESELLSDIFKE